MSSQDVNDKQSGGDERLGSERRRKQTDPCDSLTTNWVFSGVMPYLELKRLDALFGWQNID